MFTFYTLYYLIVHLCFIACDRGHGDGSVTHSIIEIRFNDSKTGKLMEAREEGHYAQDSRIAGEEGVLVHVRSIHNRSEGCDLIDPSIVPHKRWIALIKRGNCSFNDKVYFATKKSNASAVVLYNHQPKKPEQVVSPQTSGDYNG